MMKNTFVAIAGGIIYFHSVKVDCAQVIQGCQIFPSDNIWNTPVDKLPRHPNSANLVASIGSTTALHADFGAGMWDGGPIGIPYNIATNQTPLRDVNFIWWPEESDIEQYPIPNDALIEGGRDNPANDGDRHVLVVQKDTCKLYELYSTYPPSDDNGNQWTAGNGAVWDLTSNKLRQLGFTSADAAGLPILAGLVNYPEVAAGEITHAIRFTVDVSRKAYVWPASHQAGSTTSTNAPRMGERFRLKASFDIEGKDISEQAKVILRAMKKYGIIVADNGSDWFINGVPHPSWDPDIVDHLRVAKGSDFEAVDSSCLMISATSGQVSNTDGICPTIPTKSPVTKPTTRQPTRPQPTKKPARRPTRKPRRRSG